MVQKHSNSPINAGVPTSSKDNSQLICCIGILLRRFGGGGAVAADPEGSWLCGHRVAALLSCGCGARCTLGVQVGLNIMGAPRFTKHQHQRCSTTSLSWWVF